MTTLTKEWLQQTIAEYENTRDEIPFGLDEGDSNTLAALRIALASLEAEPVFYAMHGGEFDFGECASTLKSAIDDLVEEWNEGRNVPLYKTVPLYTTPPAPAEAVPVVPDEREAFEAFMGDRCGATAVA